MPECATHRRGCACREANWAEVARQLDEERAARRLLEGEIRSLKAELFMWEHSNCYCCRRDPAGCTPGCRCHPEHPGDAAGAKEE